MSKVRNFFASLNKSTKITLISCGCFIALTVVILGFFIMFPISPDDTVQEKYGREAKASKSSETVQTVTTQPSENDSYIGSKGTAVSPKVTTTRSTRKKNFSVLEKDSCPTLAISLNRCYNHPALRGKFPEKCGV